MSDKIRCAWAKSAEDIEYHDNEWGRPLHDDAKLFELLILEGMQAGLSWSTILKRRDGMRAAFDNFDPVKMAAYDDKKAEELLKDSRIIRNRLKVAAAVSNAQAYLALKKSHGSLDSFLWGYVNNTPIVNSWTDISQIPATTPLSERISKDMKKLGFKFVGPTIIYALMQSTGMVNDHLMSCFCREASMK